VSSQTRHVLVETGWDWPYKRQEAVFSGVQRYAEQQGWLVTIEPFLGGEFPSQAAAAVRYDGILGGVTTQFYHWSLQQQAPLVNVWFHSPVRNSLPGVFSDFAAIGSLRAEHLLTRGLRNFCTLIRSESRAHVVEEKAFRSTITEAGFSCLSAMVGEYPWNTLARWKRNKQILDDMMDAWELPIGVYISEEGAARTLVQMCRDRGWRVPDDVAIITGENVESMCEYPSPSLTSVEFGYERIGFEAARLLDSLMDGQPPPPDHLLLPPVGLVVRESTDFFAVEDELVADALAFISASSHRPIKADDVSKAVSAETRTLQLRFRKHLNRPIATEIRRVRMERAKRELAQSKQSLAGISRAVGFGRGTRMYQIFVRELGISPREYRKQCQQEGRP
jgi:LacI family transcriptional regulator